MHNHLSSALFALALLVTSASAQVMETIQTGDTCGFFGEDIPESVVTFSSDSEGVDVITRQVAICEGKCEGGGSPYGYLYQ